MSDKLRVLICDDDEGMRLVLQKLIEKTPGFDIVGLCDNGEDGVKRYDELRPDVVFLDVQMPKMDGLECAREITEIDPSACIIFATAHEQYMKEAFEVYAFDYLMKPFDIKRAKETLQRILDTVNRSRDTVVQKALSPFAKELNKLMVRYREGTSFVDMADIILIQREDRSTVIYTADERLVTSESLTDIFKRLDQDLFFRSHKSYIINLSMITKVYPYGRWTYVVQLKNTKHDALITYERFGELEKKFK